VESRLAVSVGGAGRPLRRALDASGCDRYGAGLPRRRAAGWSWSDAWASRPVGALRASWSRRAARASRSRRGPAARWARGARLRRSRPPRRVCRCGGVGGCAVARPGPRTDGRRSLTCPADAHDVST
jgi:hypothetical protein